MAKAKSNRIANVPALAFPKPGPKKKKKQLGFEDPPLDHCQYCGIHVSWPDVIIARHHINNKKMGGRNDDPLFHSPENRIDLCEGPCATGCHKKADQRATGYTPDELRLKKQEDIQRQKEYESLVGAP